MWTRSLLKNNAKRALSGHYGLAFAVCLMCGLLAGGLHSFVILRWRYFFHLVPALLFLIFYTVFFSWILTVGRCRFFMESRIGSAPAASVFSAFHSEGYWNIVRTKLCKYLLIALWGLLLIIPGIVKAYQYRMVDYLLAENPHLSVRRALALSRAMTAGEKGRIFLLDLSFAGWMLLGACALFAGIFLVLPYYHAACAELYCALHAKALARGLSTPQELSGFVRY